MAFTTMRFIILILYFILLIIHIAKIIQLSYQNSELKQKTIE